MKAIKYLTIAVLTLVGTAMISCDTVDNAIFLPQQMQQQAQTSNTVTLKTTVSMGGGSAEARGATRALDEHGHKTFAVGDQIRVNYRTSIKSEKAISEALTASDISPDGKSATFTVTLTDPQPNSTVTYTYPAVFNEDDLFTEQDGTLETLASKFDYAYYVGKLTAEGGLPESSVLMRNQLAVCTYILKDDKGTVDTEDDVDVTSTITDMTISDGSYVYQINRTPAEGPVYVAMLPSENVNIGYVATDGSNYYMKSVTNKTYERNNLYHLGLRMAKINAVDLSTLPGSYEAQNGDVLTGTLSGNYKITIKEGATITLYNATIDGEDESYYDWAGLTPLGDATIILEGDNLVNGFYSDNPGIYAAKDATLTIRGHGSLEANSHGLSAGIGGGYSHHCGNIVIDSGIINSYGNTGIGSGYDKNCGTITITGGIIFAQGSGGAAIGGNYNSVCSDITISGGEITASGGIGSGTLGKCGDIVITDGVTSVYASKIYEAPNSIGAGKDGTCSSVSIGGTIYWDGTNYQNGGEDYLTDDINYYPEEP